MAVSEERHEGKGEGQSFLGIRTVLAHDVVSKLVVQYKTHVLHSLDCALRDSHDCSLQRVSKKNTRNVR